MFWSRFDLKYAFEDAMESIYFVQWNLDNNNKSTVSGVTFSLLLTFEFTQV